MQVEARVSVEFIERPIKKQRRREKSLGARRTCRARTGVISRLLLARRLLTDGGGALEKWSVHPRVALEAWNKVKFSFPYSGRTLKRAGGKKMAAGGLP